MIRHLFKLIWNRKKSNFLLISEIFFSFLVLFGVLSFALYNYHNYRQPLGFTHDNVWQVWINPNTDSTAQNLAVQEQLLQRVRSFPEVAHASLASSNTPFSFNTMNGDLTYEKGKEVETHNFEVQDEFKDVLGLQLSQGRWFGPQDNSSLHPAIVINQKLKGDLFGSEDPLGKKVSANDSTHYTVIGVVNHFRPASEYAAEEGAFFGRINLSKDNKYVWTGLLIKVKPGTGVAFEEKMVKEISAIAKGWSIEVTTLEKMRQSKAKMTLVPLVAMAVVCGFLVFNVALGLFGVLWYNINKRTSEIGLRRAMGATTRQIRTQFVGEVLVMATFGLLLGLLLAVQFPLLQVFQLSPAIYWQGIGTAAVLIFLLVALCALYPSQQASRIQPAVALHEE
ncbi:ABC transporter permease [Rufibacter glacialis]|uniref:ABC transporter permease n=1 Tax=Rufibacter glacialis TaxID=1259555 RepID=A0A5M8Q7J9_9BACT|nr:FtsX-like permease family protein [Rufibacter glacialis]KAA6431041.1 FtsX-like permease family protein [Rufibacter glacialis]GGK83508.1 ABC transporter permease [Rufibacter glacialis]